MRRAGGEQGAGRGRESALARLVAPGVPVWASG